MPESLHQSPPVELYQAEGQAPAAPGGLTPRKIAEQVTATRRDLERHRADRDRVWHDCWRLYNQDDEILGDAKEDWQSQITLPKSRSSVKQASYAVSRMLREADQPWTLEAVDPNNQQHVIAGQRFARLLKHLFETSHAFKAISEGLESGFITGVGVWRSAWTLTERRTRPQVDPTSRQIIRDVRLEGNLDVRYVDPFGFLWLPGSQFNKWTGVIEDYELPVHELRKIVQDLEIQGADGKPFDVAKIVPARHSAQSDRRRARQDAKIEALQSSQVVKTCWVTEYWGPLLNDQNDVVMENGHVFLVNDEHVLIVQENGLWAGRPPYTAFSPLVHPGREDGTGLIEGTIKVNRALNRLMNMAMDREMFALLPIFEAYEDMYENPEELENLVPGTVLRKKLAQAMAVQDSGLRSVEVGGLSPQTVPLAGILDRAHQEGSHISEIMQALPRFRGAQTATETQAKAASQEGFLGSLARDIDENAITPLVEMGMDLTMQFLDTIGDKRAFHILGVDAQQMPWMDHAALLETVQGDCVLKVDGVTKQVAKMEQLQQVTQLMNIITQGGDQWMPHLNQQEVLKRVFESFSHIRDVDKLINPPEVAQQIQQQMQMQQMMAPLLQAAPKIMAAAAGAIADEERNEAAKSNSSNE